MAEKWQPSPWRSNRLFKPLRQRHWCAATMVAVAAMLLLTRTTSFAQELQDPGSDKVSKSKVRIAVVQQETIPGAVDENRAKAISHVKDALPNGADLVLFHEALLVGYVPNIHQLAEPVDGPSTRAFQKALEGTNTLIVFGLIERDGEKFYTSAVVVGAKEVIACYRKTHLWWSDRGVRHEPTFFEPGDRLVTFDVKGHKTGVMICYDGDFPEMARAYANLDCSMLLWLNNRGSRGPSEVSPLVRANTMIMATACCSGKNEAGNLCRGGSNIIDSNGSVLAEIWDKEDIVYANVDPDAVTAARQRNPWFHGQRQDLYRQHED